MHTTQDNRSGSAPAALAITQENSRVYIIRRSLIQSVYTDGWQVWGRRAVDIDCLELSKLGVSLRADFATRPTRSLSIWIVKSRAVQKIKPVGGRSRATVRDKLAARASQLNRTSTLIWRRDSSFMTRKSTPKLSATIDDGSAFVYGDVFGCEEPNLERHHEWDLEPSDSEVPRHPLLLFCSGWFPRWQGSYKHFGELFPRLKTPLSIRMPEYRFVAAVQKRLRLGT